MDVTRMLKNVMMCTVLFVNYVTSDKPRLKRHLTKNGFHRDLVTHVEWEMTAFLGAVLENCNLLLKETLPAAVYVDPFQFNSLQPFGGPQVLIDQKVDIETPEYSSSPLTLYVFIRLYTVHRGIQKHMTNVSLPLHVRYHRPSNRQGLEYVNTVINNPEVFTNCSVEGSEGLAVLACDYLNTSLCWWHQHPTQSISSAIKITVPVGQKRHMTLVVIGTLLVTVAGCLFVVYTVITKDLTMKKQKT